MLYALWQLKWEAQSLLLLALVIVAIWRGAAPERSVAAVFAGMFVLDRVYHVLCGQGLVLDGVNIGHILIDGAATVAFGVIALHANRVYPLWLTGLQLAATVSHVLRAISPVMAHDAYALLMIAPSYLQTAVFALGLLLHCRRTRRFGRYRSWQDS